MKLYVDDEPLLLSRADLEHYERVLDFRDGTLTRDLLWRTPGGKRVRVRSQRLVSLIHRHLAILSLRGDDAGRVGAGGGVVAAAQPPGRRGRVPRRRPRPRSVRRPAPLPPVRPPRPRPACTRTATATWSLGYRCANSGMTLACGYRHLVETSASHRSRPRSPPTSPRPFHRPAQPGETFRIVKLSPTTRRPACRRRSCRPLRARSPARDDGVEAMLAEQRAWLDEFWEQRRRAARRRRRPAGDPLEPVPARPGQRPDAGAGHRGQGRDRSGYEGHYFWDTETYIIPFLAYTSPDTPGSCCAGAGTRCRRPASGRRR